jgi:hypothetical protein
MSAERWPIDYETIEKGDVIPVGRIEELIGAKQFTSAYDLGLLQLTTRIEDELHERGKPWTLRTEKGAIRVLTDAEASAYNHSRQVAARKAMRRRFALLVAVDPDLLDDDQRKDHERYVEVNGKYIQADNAVRAQLRLIPNVRNVPGLPSNS